VREAMVIRERLRILSDGAKLSRGRNNKSPKRRVVERAREFFACDGRKGRLHDSVHAGWLGPPILITI